MKNRILVVDDQAELRQFLRWLLEQSSYAVSEAADSGALKEAFAGPEPDVILLDLKLPDADGLDLLPALKRQWPETEVIVLTGHASYETAVEAVKRGAFHFQEKPINKQGLLNLVERALERKQLTGQASSLRQALTTMSGSASPVFQSPVMKQVLRTIERVGPSDVSILITGESGTGKEVVADLVHALSQRNKGPCIKINCAALPRELIESELFGSVRGAFTGAQGDREGLFRLAEGGTLLLDEISEMPVDTQSKLLRVLQEKEVRPVGGRSSYKTDCRILAATNRRVEDALKQGKLREDLFYRISAITIYLPPLRERREDILPLARTFLKRYAAQADRTLTDFTPEAAERLRRHDWPGNVRQLQNEVQRAVLMADDKVVDVDDLSITDPDMAAANPESNLTLMEAMERNKIVEILQETGGNKLAASKRLGIGRQTLYNKIKAYSIAA
ncbi:MAG: sigma-54-dependent Fis family transcriptional regulator [Verrucomicrobia bacterium]|nr:sigma-54-dependent Fis family transcriptional regulator [Verrucomicrobiota bacterium]